MRTGPTILLAASLVALAGIWWIYQRDPRIDMPVTGEATARVAPGSSATPQAANARDELAPPPASLRDTAVDGELIEDADGHFVPTARALALFDYFLSATGEEPAAQIRARIAAENARRLSPGAAREADAFLDRYLGYREAAALAVSDARLAESADLERRLQWLRELRREHFGAELAATLFGDEERAVAIAIEQRRVEADASLSEIEKNSRLEALEKQLPEPIRRAREASSTPLRLYQQERELHARGGSEAELRALRESTVGSEATARLEALDQSRAEWQQRLDAYRVERDAIVADAALDAAAREAAIEAARARHFDALERTRVRVIDEMDTPPAASQP